MQAKSRNMAISNAGHNLEFANQILDSYNTENLRRSLMEYPSRISEARTWLNQARKALRDAEAEKATIEAEMILAISMETDDKGKPKFSNSEARNAELQRRKTSDPMYIETAEKVARTEAEFNEANDRLQTVIDEYQSTRIVARLIAEELGVISGLADLEQKQIQAHGEVF